MARYGLTEDSLEAIVRVFRDFSKVDEAILFGSRAMERHRAGSDIDIAVKGQLNFDDIVRLYIEMDELFLPYLFDIVDYNEISSQPVLEHIDRVGIQIFKR